MHQKDAIAQSDRALILALAIVLATASAAIGAAMTYHRTQPLPQAVAIAPLVPPAPQFLLDISAADLLADHRCLAEALYYEARGEGQNGEQAVAEVIFHRLTLGRYGHSICAVVYEGAMHPGCQFSFTCDGSLHRLREPAAWTAAEQLAEQILVGAVRLDNVTGSAINYHAVTVSPAWAPTLRKTAQIGNHIFYRNPPHTIAPRPAAASDDTHLADAATQDELP